MLTKENPKLMKAPAGKKFTLTPTDGKSADASGALAMMPSLTRFIYVLSALGSYDEKAISDMAGVSIETVKAALAVRDSNVRALSTIGGEEELTVEICAGINTAIADDELYGRAKEKIDGALAPIMERRAAVKKKMGIIGGIALALNLLSGFLLSGYAPFNIGFTSAVIVLTTLLIYLLRVIPMKEGFVIGLGFFFLFLGVVEFILGILSQPSMTDNGKVVVTIILLAIQAGILLICNSISKRIR